MLRTAALLTVSKLATLTALSPAAARWIETHEVTASAPKWHGYLGWSVGISGDTAIAGGYSHDGDGGRNGSAYLFDVTTGNELYKLTASDRWPEDLFGTSVSISGNTAIVGAWDNRSAGVRAGSAFLFDVTTGNELFKLTASDVAPNDCFGISVGIGGGTAIVGARGYSPLHPGSAYLFDATTGDELFKLNATDAAAGDRFGASVAISGNTSVIGSHSNDDAGESSGSAYLFDVTTGNKLYKMVAHDAATSDEFGYSVAVDGGLAVVGAIGNDDRGANSGSAYIFVSGPSRVVGRHIFYNNSSFSLPADNAIATDKEALQPGETATFGNYASYDLGINGIIVDIVGLENSDALNIDTIGDYFEFRVGNDNAPDGWEVAPDVRIVGVRPFEGETGSDRVTITWPDYAIRNEWLQVTILANEFTGLEEEDVFYFGNAVAEAGNSETGTLVDVADLLLARNNPRTFLDPAEIDYPYDYNRDQRVNATDVLLARNNTTNFLTSLNLITAPGEGAAMVVPEPSSLLLLVGGAVGMTVCLWRRHRR